MNWKELLNTYLGFTRRDRIGMAIVLFLIFLVFVAPKIYVNNFKPKGQTADTSWVAIARSLEINDSLNESTGSGSLHSYRHSTDPLNYFPFDPNQLDEAGWKRLGISQKTIHTIQNFLAKGGRFHKAEDLSKIYGLKKELVLRLIPFVRIERPRIVTSAVYENKANNSQRFNARIVTVVDINTADTGDFIALPGIGSKLAARIINFRDRLGGFYSIEQVAETYGLADSVFQKIKPLLQIRNVTIKKININTVSLDELKMHPYIRFQLAKAIIAYRNEHGKFWEIEEIKKVIAVTDEIFQKIKPYLEL